MRPNPTRGGLDATDPGFTQAQLAMVDIQADLIAQRDDEIRKIVETIADLAQIMRDLSTLVIEQGTMLDRIDHNIGQTAIKVRPSAAMQHRLRMLDEAGDGFACLALQCCTRCQPWSRVHCIRMHAVCRMVSLPGDSSARRP